MSKILSRCQELCKDVKNKEEASKNKSKCRELEATSKIKSKYQKLSQYAENEVDVSRINTKRRE